MATHDYVIDNQTAPNFRADLNGALQAIVSNNSSLSAPSVTYANMTWYDTASNTLYMRNEDNDAWIALGTLDQTADTFAPAGVTNLSQAQVENAASTVFGQVSGERLAQALAANASGSTAGSIGTYCFAKAGSDVSFGSTVAGSSLFPTSAIYRINESTINDNAFDLGPALSGTWRAMGQFDENERALSGGTRIYGATLWLRIS